MTTVDLNAVILLELPSSNIFHMEYNTNNSIYKIGELPCSISNTVTLIDLFLALGDNQDFYFCSSNRPSPCLLYRQELVVEQVVKAR